MGGKRRDERKERKTERSERLLAQARASGVGETRRDLGLLNLASLVGFLIVMSRQVSWTFLCISIAGGTLTLHVAGSKSGMVSMPIKAISMLATSAATGSPWPQCAGVGFGVGYASEQLLRFLNERLDVTPVLAEEGARQLRDSGKEGMKAMQLARRMRASGI